MFTLALCKLSRSYLLSVPVQTYHGQNKIPRQYPKVTILKRLVGARYKRKCSFKKCNFKQAINSYHSIKSYKDPTCFSTDKPILLQMQKVYFGRFSTWHGQDPKDPKNYVEIQKKIDELMVALKNKMSSNLSISIDLNSDNVTINKQTTPKADLSDNKARIKQSQTIYEDKTEKQPQPEKQHLQEIKLKSEIDNTTSVTDEILCEREPTTNKQSSAFDATKVAVESETVAATPTVDAEQRAAEPHWRLLTEETDYAYHTIPKPTTETNNYELRVAEPDPRVKIMTKPLILPNNCSTAAAIRMRIQKQNEDDNPSCKLNEKSNAEEFVEDPRDKLFKRLTTETNNYELRVAEPDPRVKIMTKPIILPNSCSTAAAIRMRIQKQNEDDNPSCKVNEKSNAEEFVEYPREKLFKRLKPYKNRYASAADMKLRIQKTQESNEKRDFELLSTSSNTVKIKEYEQKVDAEKSQKNRHKRSDKVLLFTKITPAAKMRIQFPKEEEKEKHKSYILNSKFADSKKKLKDKENIVIAKSIPKEEEEEMEKNKSYILNSKFADSKKILEDEENIVITKSNKKQDLTPSGIKEIQKEEKIAANEFSPSTFKANNLCSSNKTLLEVDRPTNCSQEIELKSIQRALPSPTIIDPVEKRRYNYRKFVVDFKQLLTKKKENTYPKIKESRSLLSQSDSYISPDSKSQAVFNTTAEILPKNMETVTISYPDYNTQQVHNSQFIPYSDTRNPISEQKEYSRNNNFQYDVPMSVVSSTAVLTRNKISSHRFLNPLDQLWAQGPVVGRKLLPLTMRTDSQYNLQGIPAMPEQNYEVRTQDIPDYSNMYNNTRQRCLTTAEVLEYKSKQNAMPSNMQVMPQFSTEMTFPVFPEQSFPVFPKQLMPGFPEQPIPVFPGQAIPGFPGQSMPLLPGPVMPGLPGQELPSYIVPGQETLFLPGQQISAFPQQVGTAFPGQTMPSVPQQVEGMPVLPGLAMPGLPGQELLSYIMPGQPVLPGQVMPGLPGQELLSYIMPGQPVLPGPVMPGLPGQELLSYVMPGQEISFLPEQQMTAFPQQVGTAFLGQAMPSVPQQVAPVSSGLLCVPGQGVYGFSSGLPGL